MLRKIALFLLILSFPSISKADIGYLSYSDFCVLVWFYSVVPMLLWGAHIWVAIRTFLNKKVKAVWFWFLNVYSLLVGLFILYPVSIDISEMGWEATETYGTALCLLTLAPTVISSLMIVKRIALLKKGLLKK